MQLVGGESCAVASVLLLRLIVLARFRGLAFITVCALPQFTQLLVTFVCKQARI